MRGGLDSYVYFMLILCFHLKNSKTHQPEHRKTL